MNHALANLYYLPTDIFVRFNISCDVHAVYRDPVTYLPNAVVAEAPSEVEGLGPALANNSPRTAQEARAAPENSDKCTPLFHMP